MYGRINKMTAHEGKREELIHLLIKRVDGLPGCIQYIVSKDQDNDAAVWLHEIWADKASHDTSHLGPGQMEAVAKIKSLVAHADPVALTTPIGGLGLKTL